MPFINCWIFAVCYSKYGNKLKKISCNGIQYFWNHYSFNRILGYFINIFPMAVFLGKYHANSEENKREFILLSDIRIINFIVFSITRPHSYALNLSSPRTDRWTNSRYILQLFVIEVLFLCFLDIKIYYRSLGQSFHLQNKEKHNHINIIRNSPDKELIK